ncbi:hypothetical protein ACLB90_01440 [Stenotrophomonas sp. LGBM10]|uniref:hypothetical protein n=1 Tax=Stenotrophomonas sp. LGBM10 TaxID=3390038 RepID=UPI00398AA948
MQVEVATVVAFVLGIAGASVVILLLRRARADAAVAAGGGAACAVVEARLRRGSRDLVSVAYHDAVPTPQATLVLRKGGHDAQATFHAFCEDVARILEKVVRTPPAGVRPAFVFHLRVDVITSDGDGARRTHDTRVLEMAIAADAADRILADDGRPAVSALLRHAQIRFDDPIGREMVNAFCCCERYQGLNGVSPSSTFCARALQR